MGSFELLAGKKYVKEILLIDDVVKSEYHVFSLEERRRRGKEGNGYNLLTFCYSLVASSYNRVFIVCFCIRVNLGVLRSTLFLCSSLLKQCAVGVFFSIALHAINKVSVCLDKSVTSAIID